MQCVSDMNRKLEKESAEIKCAFDALEEKHKDTLIQMAQTEKLNNCLEEKVDQLNTEVLSIKR